MNVLLIEDEEIMGQYLSRLLRARGHTLEHIYDGIVGYDAALKNEYDLIILDIKLPRRNGLSICRGLREADVSTPILMLSSNSSEKSRIEGLDAGADDYLPKPFSGAELCARLRALNRRPRNLLPTRLNVGDITLNPVKHQVTRDGELLNLRPKEYGLLEYMMRKKGQVLPRDEILSKVWGINIDNASNRLDVYVRHLRSKVDDGREVEYIHTVRGVGYMIDDVA